MSIGSSHDPWFAIRVRSRCEKLAAADLIAKGFTVCAATAPHRRIWIDRVRTIEMPLFPGYIFGRFRPADRAAIQRGTGVAGIVGAGGSDYPVSDAEMESIRSLLRSGAEVFRTPYLRAGAKVQICHGPLTGVEGTLQHVKSGYRIVVSMDLLAAVRGGRG